MGPWATRPVAEDHAYKFPGDVREWPKPGGIYGPMSPCAVCGHFPDYHKIVPQSQRVWRSPSVDTGVASYPVPVTVDEMEREDDMERTPPLHPETRFESLANEKERRVFGPKQRHMHVRVPVPSPEWPVEAEQYHSFIEDLCENIPEEWDDDVAAEAIILDYVRHLESLVPPEKRLPVPR